MLLKRGWALAAVGLCVVGLGQVQGFWSGTGTPVVAPPSEAVGASVELPGQAPGQDGRSADGIWQLTMARPSGVASRTDLVGQHAIVRFDRAQFESRLAAAPRAEDATAAGVVISLPLPNGTFQRFLAYESPILVPELAAAFPEIRTYAAQGIDDPSATVRFGWTEAGFHSIVLSGTTDTIYVDPYAPGVTDTYAVFYRSGLVKAGEPWQCLVEGHSEAHHRSGGSFPISFGTQRRTYRLALAATAEYTEAAGGVSQAVSRIATTMNRVNGIYQRELSITMTVATGTTGNPTALIYTNAATDPYTNDDGSAMLQQNHDNLTAVLGSSSWDLGHVFSTGGGGVATLGSPCDPDIKGRGVTGSANPTGDAFDVDFVAHELGHQFGGNHTYNGEPPDASTCLTRVANAAYEPASGVTIQAYAGICGTQNLAANSIDRFHVKSLDEMTAFVTDGFGGTCGTVSTSTNIPPVINNNVGLSSYSIPLGTPFLLDASASDINGDTLTYAWEQYDLGAATTTVTAATSDAGSGPLFRSYAATTSSFRSFPSATYILNNSNVPPTTYQSGGRTFVTGETMPTTARSMRFQLTVRDNRSGGGAFATASMTVSTVSGSRPFKVTVANSPLSVSGNSTAELTWDVSGTTAAPFNVSHVEILLSTDGGATFSTVVAETPNDGSHVVTVPNTATTSARVMIRALGNIFFDVNDAPITITQSTGTGPAMTTSPTAIQAAAVKAGASGALLSVTAPQTVTLSFASGSPSWTVSADQSWMSLSRSSGTGNGTFTVSIVNPGNVIGGSTRLTGTITVTAAASSNSPRTIPVTLTINQSGASSTAPTGQVDTPAQSATGVQGAIAMTGWAVDDVGIQHVRIYRQCLVGIDNPAACQTVLGTSVVFVGEASIIAGARPDVEALFPTYPAANTAGWGFLILSNLLPNIPASNASGGGVGTFQLYAVATDVEGNQRLLGRAYTDTAPAPTSVTVANNTIAKPFGAIDTPGQGATVSGTVNNFGWVLTPDSNTVADGTDILVPVNGSTINVIVDGVNVGTATYNLCRGTVGNPVPSGTLCDDDVSTIFRTGSLYRNLDAGRGPIALQTYNTALVSNGLHTIQWGVTDSGGRSEGIGSRYFSVLNSGSDQGAAARSGEMAKWRNGEMGRPDLFAKPVAEDVAVFGRTGFDLQRALIGVERVGAVPTIRVPELGRVELQVPGAKHVAHLANGTARSAPVGLALDQETGTLTWSVGPGYLGTYRLSLEREDDQVVVDVIVVPQALADEPVRMFIDRVDVGGPALSERLVRVEGWALDPQAETGSGIGAVHVWATRSAEVPGCRGAEVPECRSGATPVFLGVGDLGVARPDVAAAHGARFPAAGFALTGTLEAGEWDVTAYIWNVRTQRFEDARTVRVVVK